MLTLINRISRIQPRNLMREVRTSLRAPSLSNGFGLGLLLLVGFGSANVASAEVVNGIILRVNDKIATKVDYDKQLAERREAIRMAEMPEDKRSELMAESGTQVFREVYEDLLLRSRADQLGLFATEAEVATAVQQSKDRMGITDDDEMLQALAASGMTLEQLREKMRGGLLVQQVVSREIRSQIVIEEANLPPVLSDPHDVVERVDIAEGLKVADEIFRQPPTRRILREHHEPARHSRGDRDGLRARLPSSLRVEPHRDSRSQAPGLRRLAAREELDGIRPLQGCGRRVRSRVTSGGGADLDRVSPRCHRAE